MTETDQTREQPTSTARCLWCGSERPVDIDVCPACEHSWIDATISEAREGRLDAAAAANAVWSEPPRSFMRRHWLLISLLVAVVLVYGTILFVDSGSTDPGTTLVATTTTAPTIVVPATSIVPTTAPPTTAAPTTTTSTTTTTTTTLPPIAIVEPAYDPDDLTLGAFALGPISFGNSDPDVIGRLAATFGQPDSILPADEKWGLCQDDTGRVLEFGYLSVIMRDIEGGEELVGYRQRLKDRQPDPADLSGDLRTISGLGLASRLSDARQLYSRVVTAELAAQQDETLPPGSPIFIVQRSSDGRTLIWGELSDDDDAVVRSINSPNVCDRGPAP